MKKRLRLISAVLSALVLCVNMHAMTAYAAPVDAASAAKISNAINITSAGYNQLNPNARYHASLGNGSLAPIESFEISGLDEPKHGQLLDSTATVTSNTGLSWEIPVLWVNQDGELIRLAIDGVFICYPVFAFYIPDGYSMISGSNPAYNMQMPGFVCQLMAQNGVATMSNPQRGVTYITPILPGEKGFVAKTPAGYYDTASGDDSDSESQGNVDNGDENRLTPRPSDNYQYKNYDPKLTDEEEKTIAENHGDDNINEKLGVDNVAWFASFIKDTIEPEAVNLLLKKFPAYQEAADNDELGKDLGLYVYFNDAYDKDGNKKDNSSYVAYVEWKSTGDGGSYKLAINAGTMFDVEVDAETGEKTVRFKDEEAYVVLDTTIVHEIMHAMMYDYTMTGMTGEQYVEATDTYTTANSDKLEFPDWFVEGIATAVGSPYQYWNGTFHTDYGYDGDVEEYTKTALLDAFTNTDKKLRLSYSSGDSSVNLKAESSNTESGNNKSAYMSGYLANVYLGYLAALKYNEEDAVKENKDGMINSIDSSVILGGVNSILKELHGGKTLDEIISEISVVDGKSLYESTDDFTNKFICSSDGSTEADDEKSVNFCTGLLNYLEGSSSETKTANGSILLDFTDTSQLLLSKKLLKDKPDEYVLTDSSDYANSTVDKKKALESGGKSDTGIDNSAASGSTSDGAGDGASTGDSTGTGDGASTGDSAAAGDGASTGDSTGAGDGASSGDGAGTNDGASTGDSAGTGSTTEAASGVSGESGNQTGTTDSSSGNSNQEETNKAASVLPNAGAESALTEEDEASDQVMAEEGAQGNTPAAQSGADTQGSADGTGDASGAAGQSGAGAQAQAGESAAETSQASSSGDAPSSEAAGTTVAEGATGEASQGGNEAQVPESAQPEESPEQSEEVEDSNIPESVPQAIEISESEPDDDSGDSDSGDSQVLDAMPEEHDDDDDSSSSSSSSSDDNTEE